MSTFTRRSFLGTAAAAIGSFAALQKVAGADRSKIDPGPSNPALDGQNPDSIWATEHGNKARTMDFQEGDVGYVQKTLLHYVENTGDTDLVFLEMFGKVDRFQDLHVI